jgi:hypothetical protein
VVGRDANDQGQQEVADHFEAGLDLRQRDLLRREDHPSA